jgi:hypothetical protein
MPVSRDPPIMPSPQAPLVDAQGKPTPEFFRFLLALTEWAKAVNAAVP